jgi:hypothetical protein
MIWLGMKLNRSWKTYHRVFLFATAVFAILTGIWVFALAPPGPAVSPAAVPQYDKDGALLRPRDFHSWTFVGSSIGLSYAKGGDASRAGMFHNVYTQPEAYREFMKTGKFPEKTIFIIDMYDSTQKASISEHGYTEGERMGMDVSVKDHEHFPEGWAYFNFDYDKGKFAEKARAMPKDACFACHAAHGASDNVFTQFYPVLRKQ